MKADIAYANSKGIEVGGYDLIAWTRVVENKWMVLKEDGNVSDSACFASGWYDNILEKVTMMHKSPWFWPHPGLLLFMDHRYNCHLCN